MRLAVLGGSFNPLHLGHLFLADEVYHRFRYDKIILIPARIPPHKQLAPGASAEDRLEMLCQCISDIPYFGVDSCELERQGISYTYDTILELQKRYASVLEGKIGLIMGDDLVSGFDTWKHYQLLPDITDIILAKRMVPCAGEAAPVCNFRHIKLENSVLPISSSDIRRRIQNGDSWRYLVPDSVYRYIIQGGLYGFSDN